MAKDVVTFEWSFLVEVPKNSETEVEEFKESIMHHFELLVDSQEWGWLVDLQKEAGTTFYNGQVKKNEDESTKNTVLDYYKYKFFIDIPINNKELKDNFKRISDRYINSLFGIAEREHWFFYDSRLEKLS